MLTNKLNPMKTKITFALIVLGFLTVYCCKKNPELYKDCGCEGSTVTRLDSMRGELLVFTEDSVAIVPESASLPDTLFVCNPEAIPNDYLINNIRIEFGGELKSVCVDSLEGIYAPISINSIDIIIIDCHDTSNTEFLYFIIDIAKKPDADKLEIYQFLYKGEIYLSYEYGYPRGTGITDCNGEKICSMGGDWIYTNTCKDYFTEEITNRKLIWRNFK